MKALILLVTLCLCVGCNPGYNCNDDYVLPGGETIKVHKINSSSIGPYIITNGTIAPDKFLVMAVVEYVGWTQDYNKDKNLQVTQVANAHGSVLTDNNATNNFKQNNNSITIIVNCVDGIPRVLEVTEGANGAKPAVLLDAIKKDDIISFVPFKINMHRGFDEYMHQAKSQIDTYHTEEILLTSRKVEEKKN